MNRLREVFDVALKRLQAIHPQLVLAVSRIINVVAGAFISQAIVEAQFFKAASFAACSWLLKAELPDGRLNRWLTKLKQKDKVMYFQFFAGFAYGSGAMLIQALEKRGWPDDNAWYIVGALTGLAGMLGLAVTFIYSIVVLIKIIFTALIGKTVKL